MQVCMHSSFMTLWPMSSSLSPILQGLGGLSIQAGPDLRPYSLGTLRNAFFAILIIYALVVKILK